MFSSSFEFPDIDWFGFLGNIPSEIIPFDELDNTDKVKGLIIDNGNVHGLEIDSSKIKGLEIDKHFEDPEFSEDFISNIQSVSFNNAI